MIRHQIVAATTVLDLPMVKQASAVLLQPRGVRGVRGHHGLELVVVLKPEFTPVFVRRPAVSLSAQGQAPSHLPNPLFRTAAIIRTVDH